MLNILLKSSSGVSAVIPAILECQYSFSFANSSRTFAGFPNSLTACFPSTPAAPMPIRTTNSFDSPGFKSMSTCNVPQALSPTALEFLHFPFSTTRGFAYVRYGPINISLSVSNPFTFAPETARNVCLPCPLSSNLSGCAGMKTLVP